MSNSAQNKELSQAIRPEFLANLIGRTLALKERIEPAERAVLEDLLAEFVTRNRYPLACLLAMPSFVAENPELVKKLLGRAWRSARKLEDREWIQAEANRISVKVDFETLRNLGEMPLTDSQHRVLQELHAIAEVYFEGRALGPVAPRWTTLIIGPTGIGKSHLVRRLASSLGLETLRVGVSSWIPTGAKTEPTSLNALLERVRSGARHILHLEEADKLAGKGTDAWSQGQLTELLLLLDGSPGDSWTERDRHLFRRNFLVVATGAWQEVFECGSREIGFGSSAGVSNRLHKVQRSGRIAAELFARYGQHLILEPLTVHDFHMFAGRLGLEKEDYDADAGVASGQNMRYLESCIAQRELRRVRAQRPECSK